METDETVFQATPQTQGRVAHSTVDKKIASNRAADLLSLPVFSDEYGLMGKIDVYKAKEHKLIERKFQLKQIFQGQIYQLWAQMFCMTEMGYQVDSLFFYETSTNKMIPVGMPSENDIVKFKDFLKQYKSFNPSSTSFNLNTNKCKHCIYCSLCDKTQEDNVY